MIMLNYGIKKYLELSNLNFVKEVSARPMTAAVAYILILLNFMMIVSYMV